MRSALARINILRPFLTPILWSVYIIIPAAGWGWLNGPPLGRWEAAALALVWWAWAAERHLPGLRILTILVVAKLALGGVFVDRGLAAQYYANDTWTPPVERSAELREPGVTRHEERLAYGAAGQPDLPLYFFNDLRFNFIEPGDPKEDRLAYSAEWRGFLRHDDNASPVTFYLETAAGVSGELSLDDRSVIALDSATPRSGSITLQSGWHVVRIRVKAPYGSGRRVEAGEIVDGTKRPFDRSRVFLRPVGTARLVIDATLRWVTRLVDAIMLFWLALLVVMRARHAWRHARIGRLLFLGAIIEALAFAWGYAGRMVVMLGGDDWLMYESYARSIALGDVIGAGQKGVFQTQPLYPYFLALIHIGFGDGLFGIVLVQRLLLAATVGWIAGMTKRLFGPRAGWIALIGGGAFLYIKIGRWTNVLLTEQVFLPLLAGWIAMLVKIAADGGSASRAAAAGVLGGVTTLIRSTLLMGWPPVLLLWFASLRAHRGRMLVALLVAMLAVFSLTPLRNWIVANQFVMGPTNFGVTLYMGNEPSHPLNPAPLERTMVYDRLGLQGYVRTVIEFAIQVPGDFALGLWKKALYTVGLFGRSRLPGGSGTSWLYVGMWAFAVAGAIRIQQGSLPASSAAVWMPGAAALSHFAVMVLILPFGYTDRYIIPLYPLLIPYAAFGIEPLPAVIRRLDNRARPSLWRAWRGTAPYLYAAQRIARQVALRLVAPVLGQPLHWLSLGYSAAVIRQLEWRPEDGDAVSVLTGMLFPVTALAVAWLTRREVVHRVIGGTIFAAALVYVGARGSLAPDAVHDPLFWGVIAVLSFGASALAHRWRLIAFVASALAGACTMLSLLLPAFPDFASSFPSVDFTVIRLSFGALSGHLGVVAAVFLLGLWLHAIARAGTCGGRARRIGAAACGALCAALILMLAGVVTRSRIEPSWFAALGILIGLAEARPARDRDRRLPHTLFGRPRPN